MRTSPARATIACMSSTTTYPELERLPEQDVAPVEEVDDVEAPLRPRRLVKSGQEAERILPGVPFS
jgi:hypothetical protein